MARRVFFSFDYDRDIFRVSQIRKSYVTKDSIEEAGFFDHATWESVKRNDRAAIERWIDAQLKGASVTAVLIGAETSKSKWVDYEIKKSVQEGKGLLGIRIHQLIDPRTKRGDVAGQNPFDGLIVTQPNSRLYLSQVYPTYDWADDDGYNNFGEWVERAAKKAGR